MKQSNKKINYNLIAFLFLVLQIQVILRNYYSNYIYFYWMCDFIPTLYVIAFLLKNNQLIKSILNIGFIPQTVYLVIYTIKTLLTIQGTPAIDYTLAHTFVSLVTHFSSIYVLLITVKIDPKKQSLIYSTLILFTVYLTMILFTPVEMNTNYVFLLELAGYPNTSILWIPITFLIVVLPTYYMQKVLYKQIKTNQKSS